MTCERNTDIFVSPEGADSNPGTRDRPFASLERARQAVRTMKRQGTLPENGLTVWLRGGDYLRTSTFEFTADDSGTPEAPIAWRAYENERVRLLGGRVVTGFQAVTDEAVLARLDEDARESVLVADLRAQGIDDYGMLRSRGFGRDEIAHGELFFNGAPMTLARYPNEGEWELIADFPEETAISDGHRGTIGALDAGFFYDSECPKRWKSLEGIWLHGYWAWDWANSYEEIVELDPERMFIKTGKPGGNHGFRKGNRIYFLNILEEIDQPGEFFIDQQAGLLYFWPPQPLDNGDVLFSILEQPLLTMTDTSHVSLRGFAMEATRGNAIEITGGEGLRVEGCLIRNIGSSAIKIAGGKDHGIRSCDISDTGDGGVAMEAGDRQTLESANHFVENCHFQRQGRWSRCYVPAMTMYGVGMRASHNLIHDQPHCAILYTGNDHLFEFNDIHHVALESGDVGAIYTGRHFTYRGNRIRYNYIHETGGVGAGAVGVYMDDCVSGGEVYGNAFYKVHLAMLIGGGRDHHVKNNLFVDCYQPFVIDGRGMDPNPPWHAPIDVTIEGMLGGVPLDLYRERYPAIKDLDAYYGPPGDPVPDEEYEGVPAEGNVIENNVIIGELWEDLYWINIYWFARWQQQEVRDNFVTEDSEQVGGPETGFRLPKDSPAWGMGFEPIPFDKIGLYPDEDRIRLERVWETSGL